MSDALPDENAPVYAVRISPVASAQAAAEYDRLTQTAGTRVAEDWREGLRTAWAGLATFPLRCPIAPDDAAFQATSVLLDRPLSRYPLRIRPNSLS